MSTVVGDISNALANTLDISAKSLVRVASGASGFGSGVVCHPSGLIITNAHVVGRSPLVVTLPNGNELEARVLAISSEDDLATLKVIAEDLDSVGMGESRPAQAGEVVLALGHPWGVPGAVSAGIAIGIGTDLTDGSGREWLKASVQLRPGHSGGPMIDARGRLVGINTRMAGPDIGLAIPVNVVRAFLRNTVRESLRADASPRLH